jgi:hypothetical protein
MSLGLVERLMKRAAEVLALGKEPLVIFDLDGTLFDNRARTLRLLQEFAFRGGADIPGFTDAVSRIALSQVEYRIVDTLASVGVTNEDHIRAASAYWFDRFFTDTYVAIDLPVRGAVAFVNTLAQGGVVPVYLTGRDAPNMLQGTLASLQGDGFPVGTINTRIVLKDAFEREDLEYKADVVTRLKRTGEVIAAFDNEPGLCNLLKESFPDAFVCLIDTNHAPGAPPLRDDVITRPDFSELLR